MDFDNERDRYKHGYDAGQIVDGVVTRDEETGRLILIDEDGVGFDPQAALETLEGQTVRMTMISHRAVQSMQEMHARAQGNKPS